MMIALLPALVGGAGTQLLWGILVPWFVRLGVIFTRKRAEALRQPMLRRGSEPTEFPEPRELERHLRLPRVGAPPMKRMSMVGEALRVHIGSMTSRPS